MGITSSIDKIDYGVKGQCAYSRILMSVGVVRLSRRVSLATCFSHDVFPCRRCSPTTCFSGDVFLPRPSCFSRFYWLLLILLIFLSILLIFIDFIDFFIDFIDGKDFIQFSLEADFLQCLYFIDSFRTSRICAKVMAIELGWETQRMCCMLRRKNA